MKYFVLLCIDMCMSMYAMCTNVCVCVCGWVWVYVGVGMCVMAYGMVKPWIWGVVTDSHPSPEGKARGEGGYLAIIPRVAMV